VARTQLRVAVDPLASAEVREAFSAVKRGVVNRVVKEAIAKVARSAAGAARRAAPRGNTQAMRKSVATKYRTYKSKAVWVYLIGPRRGAAVYDPVSNRRHDPAKVAHLAERGRRAVAPTRKKSLRFFARQRMTAIFARGAAAYGGAHFMAAAWREVRRGAGGRIERAVLEGIERIGAAYAAKGKSIFQTR